MRPHTFKEFFIFLKLVKIIGNGNNTVKNSFKFRENIKCIDYNNNLFLFAISIFNIAVRNSPMTIYIYVGCKY